MEHRRKDIPCVTVTASRLSTTEGSVPSNACTPTIKEQKLDSLTIPKDRTHYLGCIKTRSHHPSQAIIRITSFYESDSKMVEDIICGTRKAYETS